MPTIIPKNELTKRALHYVLEKKLENPNLSFCRLLDDAGMRFNLSPNDAAELEHLLTLAANRNERCCGKD